MGDKVHSHDSNCIYSVAKSNGDSIEFSLSNAEQRDSWLNSGHWTLAADTIKFSSNPEELPLSQMVTYLFVIGALES